jgi:GTP-binding protein
MGLKPIVVLNKADRPDSASCIESGETESQLLDLFDALGASEDQMDYETIYASARNGWATEDLDLALSLSNNLNEKPTEEIGMDNLLDCILQSIPEPKVEVFDSDIAMANEVMPGEAFENDKFSMAAVTVGYDSYLGRTTTGRVHSGSISLGDDLVFLKATRNEEYSDSEGQGIPSESSTVSGIFINKGISRTPLDPGTAYAGDIVTISGVPDEIAVGDTLTKVSHPVEKPLKTLPVAPPILAMEFGANDGPLKGKEGTKVTPSKVRNRLIAETDNNVTLSVEQSKNSDKTMVYARGELQLGILIEQMRREGYELIISPPKIVTKFAEDGKTVLEPFEEVTGV